MAIYVSRSIAAPDGLKLHARDYPCAGPLLPVVCLPGLTRTCADFSTLAAHLAGDPKNPRRVIAIDYRGRGQSQYDRNWRRYDVRIELSDVLAVLTALGVERAVFVGTSRGGLITMGLGAVRPALVAGAVLNDIGPVVENKGLIRIKAYVGKLPVPRDHEEGGRILKGLFDAQFPKFTADDWQAYARSTWKQTEAGLQPDYDPALMNTLAQLDLESPLPKLWHLFGGLARVPVMVLRGALSDLLSPETVEEMGRRHPNLQAHTVPDQGHAPLLQGRDLLTRIARFARMCDA